MRKLLFIDTNIWLDFYRVRNDAAVKLLDHVEAVVDKVIVTYQVEAEFKKNRQAVIVETYNSLKIDTNVGRPAIFADAKASANITKGLDTAKKGVAGLKQRLGKLLDNPTQHDKVYQTCQRIFHREASIVLTRENPERRAFRHKARTRFLHGLPPRKKNDSSFGDSFNRGWIISCARRENAEVVIVSRDADFGLSFNNRSYVNDHLRQEFSERVSKKRGLYLYDNLSRALKDHFSIAVTQEEEKAEKEIAVSQRPVSPGTTLNALLLEKLRAWSENLQRRQVHPDLVTDNIVFLDAVQHQEPDDMDRDETNDEEIDEEES